MGGSEKSWSAGPLGGAQTYALGVAAPRNRGSRLVDRRLGRRGKNRLSLGEKCLEVSMSEKGRSSKNSPNAK